MESLTNPELISPSWQQLNVTYPWPTLHASDIQTMTSSFLWLRLHSSPYMLKNTLVSWSIEVVLHWKCLIQSIYRMSSEFLPNCFCKWQWCDLLRPLCHIAMQKIKNYQRTHDTMTAHGFVRCNKQEWRDILIEQHYHEFSTLWIFFFSFFSTHISWNVWIQ